MIENNSHFEVKNKQTPNNGKFSLFIVQMIEYPQKLKYGRKRANRGQEWRF